MGSHQDNFVHPSISAVVPALNEGETIHACLRALCGQSAPVDEIILADGGSTDGTVQAAAGLSHRIVHTDPGRAVQMNAGAKAARGEVLWFVHADTLVPPGAARAIREAIAGGAVWGRFDIRLSGSHMAFRMLERMVNWRSRLSGIATGDQGMFVRRDGFERLGGFPRIALMEDVALSCALKRQARPACLQPPLITSSRRWETQGIARTIWLMWRLRFAYWRGADPEQLARRYARAERP